MRDDELKETLLDIERRGWDSLCDSTGASFYGVLMSDDAVMVLANGAILDREAAMESLQQATPWRTYTIDDVRLIRTGSDGATLVYRGSGYRDSDAPAFVGVMSSVYRRHGDEWRLGLYQQTPVPLAPAPAT